MISRLFERNGVLKKKREVINHLYYVWIAIWEKKERKGKEREGREGMEGKRNARK